MSDIKNCQVLSLEEIKKENHYIYEKIDELAQDKGIRRSINLRIHLSKIEGITLNAATLLSQMMHWSLKATKEGGYFYKTFNDWNKETLLKHKAFHTARKKLKDLKIIDWETRGVPATCNYKVNAKILWKLMDEACSEEKLQPVDNSSLNVDNSPVKKFAVCPRDTTGVCPRDKTITKTTTEKYLTDNLLDVVDNFSKESYPQPVVSDIKIKKKMEESEDPPPILLDDLTNPDTFTDSRDYWRYNEETNLPRKLYIENLLPRLIEMNKVYDLGSVDKIMKTVILRQRQSGKKIKFRTKVSLINYMVEVFRHEKTKVKEINNNPDWTPPLLFKHWKSIGII